MSRSSEHDSKQATNDLIQLLGQAHRNQIRPLACIPLAEIRKAFEPLSADYPPILSLKQAAALAGIAPSTLKRHVSEGLYKDCVSRRKPLRFWRDLFAQAVMKNKKNRPKSEAD